MQHILPDDISTTIAMLAAVGIYMYISMLNTCKLFNSFVHVIIFIKMQHVFTHIYMYIH